MSSLGPVVVMILVGVPTISAMLTEINRRNPNLCPHTRARWRRGDALSSGLWSGMAIAELFYDGPTALFWCMVYGAVVYAWAWWRGGGDDQTRRTLEKGTGRVTQLGARLVVVPNPA